jgi:hypothetical protein
MTWLSSQWCESDESTQAGNAVAAEMPMMAAVIVSSISVKPYVTAGFMKQLQVKTRWVPEGRGRGEYAEGRP